MVRKLLNTEFAELALAGHADAGRDEFRLLDEEFRKFIEKTSVPTPAIDELSGRPHDGKRNLARAVGEYDE